MDTYSDSKSSKKKDTSRIKSREQKFLENFQNELSSFVESKLKNLFKEIYDEKKEEILTTFMPKVDYFGGQQETQNENIKSFSNPFNITNKDISEEESSKNFEEKSDGEQKIVKSIKNSFTKYELLKDSVKAVIITGIGTGALATFFFDYKIGLILGLLSAALNVYGVFYRNKHYSKYYSNET